MNAVVLTGLVKRFGATTALSGLDLAVPEGSIFGFLGPNGAGKTTTLRLLTGLARPTAGRVELLGSEIGGADAALNRQVGFLPDVPSFYPWMTAREFMHFAGRLFGLGDALLRARADALLAMAGLGEVRTRIGGFSRGMKQRLGIAQAMVNAPRLLLLDEPTSALDPIGRLEVLEMVAALRGRTTVFFSTHILGDVERVCDTVAILDRGAVVAGGTIDELKRRYATKRIAVELDGTPAALALRVAGRPWLIEAEESPSALRLTVRDVDAAREEIIATLAESRLPLRRFEIETPTLEELFVELLSPGRQ